MKNPIYITAALLYLSAAPVSGAEVNGKPPPAKAGAARADSEASRLNAEVIRTATEYRDQLALQMKLEASEVDRRARDVEFRAQWFDKDYISRQEWEQSKQALASARAKLADTAQRIEQAGLVLGEAEARSQLASLPALPPGGYSESGSFVRYNGSAPWSLADSGKVEKFFAARFGHPLPVSARGETEAHRQMRFDHANAMDVALHPDSAEGRALMEYLRQAGIPFLAFRGKMAGAATGAHIHIGKPSVRLARP